MCGEHDVAWTSDLPGRIVCTATERGVQRMAEFHVVIEGLELDREATQAINGAIQQVVLDHLASVDITSGRSRRAVIGFRPKPDWYGIVAEVVAQDELMKVPAFKNRIEQFG